MKTLRLLLLSILLSIAVIMHVQAADISVETSLNQNKGYIGDPLQFELKITADTVLAIDTMPVPDNLEQFELRNWRIVEDQVVDSKRLIRYDALMTAYETGKLIFPALPVIYHPKEGVTDTLDTDSLDVYILSLVMNDSTADIKSLKTVKSLNASSTWIYILAAIIVILGVATWFIIRRIMKPEDMVIAPEMLMSPWEAAHLKLSRLNVDDLPAKVFYFQISEIIREYIERRWGLSAPDMTTYEIKLQLPGLNFDQDLDQLLIELLEFADLVKFAKLEPPHGRRYEDFEQAKSFIDQTTPAEDRQEVKS